jgi:hypothetical protein
MRRVEDGTVIELKLMGNLEIAYGILKDNLKSLPKDIAYDEASREMIVDLELPPRNVAHVLNLAEQLLDLEYQEEKKKNDSTRLTVFNGIHGYDMIKIEGIDGDIGSFVLICEHLKKHNNFPLCKKDDVTYEFLTTDRSYVKSLAIEIAKQLEFPIIFTFEQDK